MLQNLEEWASYTVAIGLLGIVSSSLKKHYYNLKKLKSDFKEFKPIPIEILRFIPSFKEKIKTHTQAMEAFLETEIVRIKYLLGINKDDAVFSGLLAQKIVEKIQQNPNALDLHKDPELKSLVLLLLALDNLHQVMHTLASRLKADAATNQDLHIKLKKEIETSGVLSENEIKPLILMNKTQMPHLHNLYQQCLDLPNFSVIALRYAKSGLKNSFIEIPKRTYLLISSPLEISTRSRGPVPSSVFSEGPRKCPGRMISEAAFKAITVRLVFDDFYVKK